MIERARQFLEGGELGVWVAGATRWRLDIKDRPDRWFGERSVVFDIGPEPHLVFYCFGLECARLTVKSLEDDLKLAASWVGGDSASASLGDSSRVRLTHSVELIETGELAEWHYCDLSAKSPWSTGAAQMRDLVERMRLDPVMGSYRVYQGNGIGLSPALDRVERYAGLDWSIHFHDGAYRTHEPIGDVEDVLEWTRTAIERVGEEPRFSTCDSVAVGLNDRLSEIGCRFALEPKWVSPTTFALVAAVGDRTVTWTSEALRIWDDRGCVAHHGIVGSGKTRRLDLEADAERIARWLGGAEPRDVVGRTWRQFVSKPPGTSSSGADVTDIAESRGLHVCDGVIQQTPGPFHAPMFVRIARGGHEFHFVSCYQRCATLEVNDPELAVDVAIHWMGGTSATELRHDAPALSVVHDVALLERGDVCRWWYSEYLQRRPWDALRDRQPRRAVAMRQLFEALADDPMTGAFHPWVSLLTIGLTREQIGRQVSGGLPFLSHDGHETYGYRYWSGREGGTIGDLDETVAWVRDRCCRPWVAPVFDDCERYLTGINESFADVQSPLCGRIEWGSYHRVIAAGDKARHCRWTANAVSFWDDGWVIGSRPTIRTSRGEPSIRADVVAMHRWLDGAPIDLVADRIRQS